MSKRRDGDDDDDIDDVTRAVSDEASLEEAVAADIVGLVSRTTDVCLCVCAGG